VSSGRLSHSQSVHRSVWPQFTRVPRDQRTTTEIHYLAIWHFLSSRAVNNYLPRTLYTAHDGSREVVWEKMTDAVEMWMYRPMKRPSVAPEPAASDHLTIRHYVETCHPAHEQLHDVTRLLIILAQLSPASLPVYRSATRASERPVDSTPCDSEREHSQLQTVIDDSLKPGFHYRVDGPSTRLVETGLQCHYSNHVVYCLSHWWLMTSVLLLLLLMMMMMTFVLLLQWLHVCQSFGVSSFDSQVTRLQLYLDRWRFNYIFTISENSLICIQFCHGCFLCSVQFCLLQ